MNLNVLYVEDNIEYQQYSIELFKKFFQNIDSASNGEEGLRLYLEYYEKNNHYYDLVITDMEMPSMTGIDMAKAIYKENKDQIIVVISAYNNPKYLIDFINTGVYHFILKPYNINNIIDTFNDIKCKLNKHQIHQLTSDLYYSSNNMTVIYQNEIVKLTKKENLFLNLLTKNIDNIINYDIIYYTLWEDDIAKGNSKILNPIISKLKKKLKDDVIINIYGIGYKIGSYND